jgi:hypothetical protein
VPSKISCDRSIAASRSILLRWRSSTGDEGLGSTKCSVVLGRRDVLPGEPCYDRAVRKGKRSLLKRLQRNSVAQNRAEVIKVAGFMGHIDQGLFAVTRRNCYPIDRRRLGTRILRCLRRDAQSTDGDDGAEAQRAKSLDGMTSHDPLLWSG